MSNTSSSPIQPNNSIVLTGRYSRSIKIYFFTIAAILFVLFVSNLLSGSVQWQDVLFFIVYFLFALLLYFLYAKPIRVEFSYGRVYIRKKPIDVTRRVKSITRLSESTLRIKFNILYQLNVEGTKEQLDFILEDFN